MPIDPSKKKSFIEGDESLLLNPKPFLDKLKGQRVSMRIMTGSILQGTLGDVTNTCDLTLLDWEELVFGKVAWSGTSRKVFRDNVMYVRGPKPGEAATAAASATKTQEETPAAPAASEP